MNEEEVAAVSDAINEWVLDLHSSNEEVARAAIAALDKHREEKMLEEINMLARISQRLGARGTEEQIEEAFRQSLLAVRAEGYQPPLHGEDDETRPQSPPRL